MTKLSSSSYLNFLIIIFFKLSQEERREPRAVAEAIAAASAQAVMAEAGPAATAAHALPTGAKLSPTGRGLYGAHLGSGDGCSWQRTRGRVGWWRRWCWYRSQHGGGAARGGGGGGSGDGGGGRGDSPRWRYHAAQPLAR